MIEGPWGAPRIYPEMQGMLDNPEAAYAQLKQMGKGLFGPGGAGHVRLNFGCPRSMLAKALDHMREALTADRPARV